MDHVNYGLVEVRDGGDGVSNGFGVGKLEVVMKVNIIIVYILTKNSRLKWKGVNGDNKIGRKLKHKFNMLRLAKREMRVIRED